MTMAIRAITIIQKIRGGQYTYTNNGVLYLDEGTVMRGKTDLFIKNESGGQNKM